MPNETAEVRQRLAAIANTMDDALITTDVDGIVTTWNAGAGRLFGFQSTEICGQPIDRLLPPDRIEEERDVMRRVRSGESIRDLQTVRSRRDESSVPVSLNISPILGDDGEVVGTVRIARDIAAWQRIDRAARRLAAIVESSDDAIVSKDLNGIITSWNRAAERMFGYSPGEVIGRSIRILIPADRQTEEDGVLASLRRGEKVDHFETVRQRKDGTLVNISLTVSPIFDDNGHVVGASKIARDITDRTRLEAERIRLLQVAEENAAVTEKLNHVGAIVASELNRDTIVQAVTDAATELTGAACGAFFYNVVDERGDTYTLHTTTGAPLDTSSPFPIASKAAVFAPFPDDIVVRSDDVTEDPRYNRSEAHVGLPPWRVPVRSYLAVPVTGRSGTVLGGLFFGHPDRGRFEARHERIVEGIASWASIALENARLYVGVQESSRLKDEFLATLSHELRTPLNAILGYARMIRAGIVAPERQQRAFETIERNATSLTQIVEDVLDVSRIIAGKMRLNVQPVDVSSIVRNVVEGVMPAAEARGVGVHTALDPLAGPASGDPERIQQIAWNLLSNAVKFTNRGGRVHVSVQEVHSHIELRISDTGIGIQRAFLPHVFERFRQGDAGTTRVYGGLGLGLSITRQLVEMHGGRISASSEGEGKGATFCVELPLLVVAAETAGRDQPHPHAAEAGSGMTVPDLTGVHVLAVDDDPDALSMVREIGEATGARVSVASSAQEALALLEMETPDLIVADLGMPRMDGFALISRIRDHGNERVRNLPAAALTAYARSEDRAKALHSGFQLHLSKPIDPGELMAAIASLAGRAAARS